MVPSFVATNKQFAESVRVVTPCGRCQLWEALMIHSIFNFFSCLFNDTFKWNAKRELRWLSNSIVFDQIWDRWQSLYQRGFSSGRSRPEHRPNSLRNPHIPDGACEHRARALSSWKKKTDAGVCVDVLNRQKRRRGTFACWDPVWRWIIFLIYSGKEFLLTSSKCF